MASDPWWHKRFASVRIDEAAFDAAGVERARAELAAALGFARAGREPDMSKDGVLEVPGVVSIWAGRLPDEDALDDYVSFRYPPDGEGWSPFTREHGLGWVDEDHAEAGWFAGGSYSLVGHSYGDWFAAAADVDLARRFPDANSVYLVYDFDASAVPVSGSPLLGFLGAYPYRK